MSVPARRPAFRSATGGLAHHRRRIEPGAYALELLEAAMSRGVRTANFELVAGSGRERKVSGAALKRAARQVVASYAAVVRKRLVSA